MYRNRVWHLGSTGCCRSAGAQWRPASLLTSTRVIRPRPLQAIPVICHQPLSPSVTGYAGNVMIDFASITKLNWRAVSSESGSVYFDVSSRVMNGRSASSIRRIHLTLAFPSQPGNSSRAGYPCSGRSASPFWPYAMKPSSQPLSTGMLRAITAASSPSARNHVAPPFTPTSRNRVDRSTPVHSLVLVRPSMNCGDRSGRMFR